MTTELLAARRVPDAAPTPPEAVPATADGLDVLHVTRATAAGVRRHVLDLMTGLNALGLRQGLLYAASDADDAFWLGLERLQRLGVVAEPVEMPREISPLADLAAVREVAAAIRRHRPKVLHLHSSKAGAIGRLAALAAPRTRVVYSPHASAANLSRAYAAIEILLGRLRTDRLVAVSASERVELARLRVVKRRRLTRVNCGIAPEELRAAAAEPVPVALGAGPLVVACGRLSPQKDPLFLVRVSERVLAELPSARFVWIGDGPLRSEVEDEIHTRGVAASWQITGWLANPFPVLARASVFALPSRYESFGYVTLEAMMLGRPVVGTRTTGTRDLVVPDRTGYLVDVGDEQGFASALVRVLLDPAHAADLGKAAASVAGRFTRDRMAAGMRAVYAGVAPVGAVRESA